MFDKSPPAANAAGQEWWIDVTDDANRKKRHREEILLTAYAGTGTSTERTGRMEDQVRQTRRNHADGSGGTPLTESGGGVMSTGGEDVMKISAVRPLSVEAVEFSPAPATGEDRRPGRKTMSSGTGGSSPTKVVELPLSKAGGGGGGGEVHGDGGASQAALNG